VSGSAPNSGPLDHVRNATATLGLPETKLMVLSAEPT